MRTCEICGKEINPERAEALPETRLCIEHAKEIEKHGGEFKLTGHMESTSKVGSLKKNYGGINVEKKRNFDAIDKLKRDYEEDQSSEGYGGWGHGYSGCEE